jgi:phosphonate transport system substrate-binding protein
MKSPWFILLVVVVIAGGIYTAFRPVVQEEIPAVIRVGVLPDMEEESIHRRYKPLLDYLMEETGYEFELVVPSDYSGLVQLFRDHEVDLVKFGGLTFVQAHSSYGATPLVMRDVDARFTSYFLTRGTDPADELDDFKGRVFSFGSRLSTSGHLMPRHFLKSEKQIVPEAYFSEVRYSGTHDRTAYLVRDGVVDLGVANSEIIRRMFQDGSLNRNDIRILWETPPFPDYVWVVQENLSQGVKTQLRDAFLKLDFSNARHNKILSGLGARIFLPAGVNEFLPLKRDVEALGLMKPEIE